MTKQKDVSLPTRPYLCLMRMQRHWLAHYDTCAFPVFIPLLLSVLQSRQVGHFSAVLFNALCRGAFQRVRLSFTYLVTTFARTKEREKNGGLCMIGLSPPYCVPTYLRQRQIRPGPDQTL